MEIVSTLFDFIVHIKTHLEDIITHYPTWFYWVIFLVIFIETGFVIMPFLPGDSLLFAIGALSVSLPGKVDIWSVFGVLVLAAILGDTLNYHIGKFLGPKVFSGNFKYLNKQHLEKTQAFYVKYGGKTIIMARFVPIVRTFAPFVAGIGTMNYSRFIQFNIVGAILWVGICLAGGYWFGGLPFVAKHFELVLIGIIGISLLPVVFEVVREKLKK
jgi:membrane-associated protein